MNGVGDNSKTTGQVSAIYSDACHYSIPAAKPKQSTQETNNCKGIFMSTTLRFSTSCIKLSVREKIGVDTTPPLNPEAD